MKYLRQLTGRRVLVQLKFEGVAAEGQLSVAAADHIELVDVALMAAVVVGDKPKPADGTFYIPRDEIAWVQVAS